MTPHMSSNMPAEWSHVICRGAVRYDGSLAIEEVFTWVTGRRGLVVSLVGLPPKQSISLTAEFLASSSATGICVVAARYGISQNTPTTECQLPISKANMTCETSDVGTATLCIELNPSLPRGNIRNVASVLIAVFSGEIVNRSAVEIAERADA